MDRKLAPIAGQDELADMYEYVIEVNNSQEDFLG